MRKNTKRLLTVFLLVMIALSAVISAEADRIPEKKPYNYIGAMRVMYAKEWISLREEPHKTSARLAKIPVGDIVYSCVDINDDKFYKCEYQGQTGYVLKGYLRRAPEFEPPVSSSITKKMTMDELIGTGEIVLDWKEFNLTVVAAHETVTENRKKWEVLRVGGFLDGKPLWGHEEKLEIKQEETNLLKAFIGGVADDWQVMLFDGGYGLSMLDLLSGKEKWMVTVAKCPMGDGTVTAVDANGTVYIAGSNGPDPAAISMDGHVLWQANVNNPGVYNPFEITVEGSNIFVKYESGMTNGYKLVTLNQTGEVVSIRNQRSKAEENE